MPAKPLTIGEHIVAARKAAGLTQAELADACESITQSRISEIERGDREASVPVLCRIADALDLSLLIDSDGARLVDPRKIRTR